MTTEKTKSCSRSIPSVTDFLMRASRRKRCAASHLIVVECQFDVRNQHGYSL